MRPRLETGVDRFIDIRNMNDSTAATMISDLEIDIAVDLKGFTRGERAGILAYRPAPIQVNYLGYPGTMGADFIDYIIADSIVIPMEDDRYYSERVVRLPDCYQVNDSKRLIADRTPTRAEVGLPEHAFVYCCFNGNFKITPTIFDVWMRILRRVDRSVLWLFQGSASAEQNLRREAELRGIEPERLVFAAKIPLDQHLARHRLADLFLDTLPYNAHTTASDALWAGLPVLTCIGRTFAGRVAASLLHSMNISELVTGNLEEYETRAVELGNDPARLRHLRERLAHNISVSPLFDTDRFRRNIEAAYATMWETYRRGEQPHGFAVKAFPT
jgi:predicted O-linked N-acetylglucosamine transferase (SPINDLY family)